jgi:predicted aspartyl protease
MRTGCTIGVVLAASAAAMAADPPPVPVPKLVSPAGHYSLKLNSLRTPESQTEGLYFKARIDGGPVLRMLLDSGAQHVVLDRRSAAKVGGTSGTALEMVGAGAASKACQRAAPGTIQIGDLVVENCPILVAAGPIMDGIDGVIPMSLFAGFLLCLNVPGKVLELDAYPAAPPDRGDGYLQARADNRLLFLHSVLNGLRSGYVLLDTGATYNAVSPEAARASRRYWSVDNSISLLSSAGGVEGYTLPPGVRFGIGSRVFSADPAVVVDLSDLSRHHPFEITGILGYPALRNSIVTLDYRDSLVRIEGK